jgi:hypothetical protein
VPSSCRDKVQKDINVADVRQACLQTNEASGRSVPEMGFFNVILEKDGRRFRNLPRSGEGDESLVREASGILS